MNDLILAIAAVWALFAVVALLAIVTDAPLNDDLDSLGDPAAFDHLLPREVRELVGEDR